MSVYENIMAGLEESLEHAQNKKTLRTTTFYIEPLQEYAPEEIKKIRIALGMTQVLFASFLGVSPKTVEAWESGRNRPEGPARRMLSLVQRDPQLPERYSIVTRE